MPRDDATVLDIIRAARLVIEFRGNLDKAAFFKDLKMEPETASSEEPEEL